MNRTDHSMIQLYCCFIHAFVEEESLCLLLELIGGLGGKGGQDDLIWFYLVCFDQLRKRFCQFVCLTATSACINICYVLHAALVVKESIL